MPRRIAGMLIGAVALLTAACTPLPTATPVALAHEEAIADFDVTTEGPTDVEVVPADAGIRLDVTSESGIGSAGVTWKNDSKTPVSLRLHVDGLEEFRFTYDMTAIVASISSNGDFQIRQSLVGDDGAQEPLTPESPFWLTIEPTTADGQSASSIPLEGGYFDVTPPADFFDNPTHVFVFSWIDFYR